MSSVARQRMLRIIDKGAVTQALSYLRELYVERPRELYKDLKLRQPHISKLLHQKIESVTQETYERIQTLLPPHKRPEFEAAFAHFSGSQLTAHYQQWLDRSTYRLLGGVGRRWIWSHGTFCERADNRRSRAGEREGELLTLQRYIDNHFDGIICNFYSKQEAKGHSEQRIQLAIYRVLAPLLVSSDAAFVEQHWREMQDSDLRIFVKAGLKREELLLKRSADLQRVQEIVELDRKAVESRFGRENIKYSSTPHRQGNTPPR